MNNKFNKKIVVAITTLFLAINTTIIIMTLIKIKNMSINVDNISKHLNIIILVILLMIAYYLEIVIHELGHFIAGKINGFELYSFSIFPITIKKQSGKKNLNITGNFGQLGSCGMYPSSFENISRKLIIYYLGGIALNLISIVLVVFLILNKVANSDSFFTKIFFSFFLIISEFHLVQNTIPSEINGLKTDGAKVMMLTKHSYLYDLELIEQMISLQLFSGYRPRELDMKSIDNAEIFGDIKFFRLISIYWLYYHLDNNNFIKVGSCIDVVEKNIDKYSSDLGQIIIFEILYYYSYIKKDIQVSDEKYNSILKMNLQNKGINSFRAEMAYFLYIKHDYEKALQLGTSALHLIEKEEVRGIAVFEEIKIRKMIDEIGSFSYKY